LKVYDCEGYGEKRGTVTREKENRDPCRGEKEKSAGGGRRGSVYACAGERSESRFGGGGKAGASKKAKDSYDDEEGRAKRKHVGEKESEALSNWRDFDSTKKERLTQPRSRAKKGYDGEMRNEGGKKDIRTLAAEKSAS